MSENANIEYLYTLFDNVAKRSGAVMQFVNDATAVRDVCLKFKDSPYYKDVELRRIGAVDVNTGWCVECASCVVALPPASAQVPNIDTTLKEVK